MTGELALRFVLGGAIVSMFAVAGELFEPKTFAGLFGAAPSVAIATLALAYSTEGVSYAAIESRSMLIGAAAMLVYGAACVVATRREGVPVWLGAALAWGAWGAVAVGIWGALCITGTFA